MFTFIFVCASLYAVKAHAASNHITSNHGASGNVINSAKNNTSIDTDLKTLVVTIKPIYSLVAYLTKGITTPVLLSENMASPHHYNMRPTERRLISNADMIIWLGPEMETYLPKIIQQQKNSTISIPLIQADKLTLLNKRTKHAHDHHQENKPHSLTQNLVDQHIWLSTNNMKAMSYYLSEKLISHDPDNTNHYKNNLKKLIIKIDQTDTEIKEILGNNKQPFMVAHDAFQYFEKEYGLNYLAAINTGEDTNTSLKHLSEINALMKEHKIQCLLYQTPKPAIINRLTRNSKIKAIALDPLGLNINTNNDDIWFTIMKKLALNFKQCLTQLQTSFP